MKRITFYLDFISPYAYLAFEALPEALKGLSYSVTYKPLLFAALLCRLVAAMASGASAAIDGIPPNA